MNFTSGLPPKRGMKIGGERAPGIKSLAGFNLPLSQRNSGGGLRRRLPGSEGEGGSECCPDPPPLEALKVGANLERLRLWSSRHFAKALLLQTAFKFDLIQGSSSFENHSWVNHSIINKENSTELHCKMASSLKLR